MALVLVVALASQHNKAAVIEAIDGHIKRDSLAPQPRQPRNRGTGPDSEEGRKARVSLEDVIYGKFLASEFNGTWVSGNEVRHQRASSQFFMATAVSKTGSNVSDHVSRLQAWIKYPQHPD